MKRKKKLIWLGIGLLFIAALLLCAATLNQDLIINGYLRINKTTDNPTEEQKIYFGSGDDKTITYNPTNGCIEFSKPVKAGEFDLYNHKISSNLDNMIIESEGDIIIQLGD
jgi:hypothetical protein